MPHIKLVKLSLYFLKKAKFSKSKQVFFFLVVILGLVANKKEKK